MSSKLYSFPNRGNPLLLPNFNWVAQTFSPPACHRNTVKSRDCFSCSIRMRYLLSLALGWSVLKDSLINWTTKTIARLMRVVTLRPLTQRKSAARSGSSRKLQGKLSLHISPWPLHLSHLWKCLVFLNSSLRCVCNLSHSDPFSWVDFFAPVIPAKKH